MYLKIYQPYDKEFNNLMDMKWVPFQLKRG